MVIIVFPFLFSVDRRRTITLSLVHLRVILRYLLLHHLLQLRRHVGDGKQLTNCWYCCNQWGVGKEIGGDVKRDEVEKQVRSLMVGEEGEEMRRRAAEWKKLAEEAAKGASRRNLRRVIDEVLLGKV
ncbi:hypothetical protein SASPL_135423 [Salvia splendens]|uniref:Uncharacterized protein n=1 Tax=Salvia splendens TaxID=180675 RepID=A0A8X8WY46_SALSN|nr:hypothetical protein SASPL_135423 [Salvia splendens]